MLGAAQGRGRPSDRPPQEATPTPHCGEERAQGPGPPVEAGTSAASGAESRGGEGEVWGETPWLRSAPALASCSTERSRRRAVELRADRPGDGSVEGPPSSCHSVLHPIPCEYVLDAVKIRFCELRAPGSRVLGDVGVPTLLVPPCLLSPSPRWQDVVFSDSV